MGWSSCGTNKHGQKIGYAHNGKCGHPGCKEKINHGLSYVCGNMHEGGMYGCGKYFCTEHLKSVEYPGGPERESDQLCFECAISLELAIKESAIA